MLFRSRVLAELQQKCHPNLQLLIYGEAPNSEMAQLLKEGAKSIAPTLTVHWVPGSKIEMAGAVRWASDVFVSLADNPQETFGITPLEAMASGLPCVVSDWDGYRDTVVQPGEGDLATGFRIKTRLIDGLGKEESEGLLSESISYDQAVGRLAQGIAVDPGELAKQLNRLLKDAPLRETMGQAGQARVKALYRWEVVIEQWNDLLEELQHRRVEAQRTADKIGRASCRERV